MAAEGDVFIGATASGGSSQIDAAAESAEAALVRRETVMRLNEGGARRGAETDATRSCGGAWWLEI